MGGAEGAWAAAAAKAGGSAANKPARGPYKADDFKRALARAAERAGAPPAAAAAAPPRAHLRDQAASARPPAPDAAFRARIARAETGAARADQGYNARNAASGALGRDQLTPQALRDLGWKDAGGGWTALAARHGVGSDAAFLASPAAQEAAMGAYLRRAETQLDRNSSLSQRGGTVTGLDGTPVCLTEAGLVAAAHRRGAGSVARYLAHRGASSDASPLTASERRAFAAVERRLRDFAELPYAVAARPGRGTPAA